MHNEETHNSYCSQNINRVIKLGIKMAEYVKLIRQTEMHTTFESRTPIMETKIRKTQNQMG
jgi:hypothetical protein